MWTGPYGTSDCPSPFFLASIFFFMYTTFCNFLCITVWHIYNKNNQTVVSIHTGFHTYEHMKPGMDRNYYCTSMNITTKFSTLKLLFFSFSVVWLLNRFRGFLVPRPNWIKDLYVFGTLGLHRLLTKTLNFFLQIFKISKIKKKNLNFHNFNIL